MKSMKTFVAVAVLVALSSNAQAGLFGGHKHKGCGASKCCDCAPTFQPSCCKPTITRPCHVNVYNYQRSCAKPMSSNTCAPSSACCPSGDACNNGANACAPNAAACAAPSANACAPGANACAPGANACAPGANACSPAAAGCAAPCADDCCDTCCPTNACEIAELIYQSQTACYAKDRRKAIHKLGDRYSCVCSPEIMAAFVYALNDADERVRAKAADEIGDQLRKNPCCCSQCVVNALTVALADCDRHVRRQAEEALEQCGYEIVDGCCEVVCDSGCTNTCAPAGCAPSGAPAAPAPMKGGEDAKPAPAPVPPAEGSKAYFPKRLPQQSARPASVKKSLSSLFSLLD